MGPHVYQPIICQILMDCGALSIVKNASELTLKIDEWIKDVPLRNSAGQAEYQVLQDHAGAISKTLECSVSKPMS